MTLVADKPSMQMHDLNSVNFSAAIDRWQSAPSSAFTHHGRRCCSTAREWLFATDQSQLSGQHKLTGPRWLLQKYKWGPSQWPMTWCRAVEEKYLDCGALAFMSKTVFAARSVNSYSVQLIQQYTDLTTYQWSKKWTDHPASTHWIHGALIYHEVCAVEITTNEIKLWDSSAACWINARQKTGYGSVVGMRIRNDDPKCAKLLTWGEHLVTTDEWHILRFRKHLAPSIHLVKQEQGGSHAR